MASIASSQLIIQGIQRSQANALRKKAEKLGVTAEDYVKDLIALDLELDKAASSKSFAELAMPFQKALSGLTDKDLNALARSSKPRARR